MLCNSSFRRWTPSSSDVKIQRMEYALYLCMFAPDENDGVHRGKLELHNTFYKQHLAFSSFSFSQLFVMLLYENYLMCDISGQLAVTSQSCVTRCLLHSSCLSFLIWKKRSQIWKSPHHIRKLRHQLCNRH